MAKNKPNLSFLYIFMVSAVSFVLAIIFFSISNLLAERLQSIVFSVVFLVIIILVGIIADILGVSVAAANEAPLHAKAAKRVSGASEGVYLIRNADRVSNIANDVIGDIAGTVSGALGIVLVLQILVYWQEFSADTLSMFLTALIAAVTVGGKAFSKWIALTYAEEVVFISGKCLYIISVITSKSFNSKTKKHKVK